MCMEMRNLLLRACRLLCTYNAQFYLQAEQITAEYKVQALQFHPDKNAGNKEAEEKFQKLKVRTFNARNVKCVSSYYAIQ
jgi:hypothetical protein